MPPPRKKTKTAHRTADQNDGGCEVATVPLPLPRFAALSAIKARREHRVKLTTVPLDVLEEVFSYLHPRDLLNVALTSRRIAAFLLHPGQEFIWRKARLRTPGLPKLPPFMGERAFARFLYSRRCNHCGQDGVHNVRWTWFARYCRDCLPEARYDGPSAYSKYYHSSEYLRDYEDLNELVNVHSPSKIHDVFAKKCNYVQRRQLDQFLQEWQAAETEEARCELLKRQKTLVKRRERHAERLQRWYRTAGAAERRKANRLAKIDMISRSFAGR